MGLRLTPVIESPTDQFPDQANSAGIVLTASRLRTWGTRSVLSLLDQGLTSAAGFIINILLARWVLPELYGAFAVAFAGYLFVSGFHNVMLLEPLSIIGPSTHANRLPAYFREQLAVHAILVGPLSLAVLMAGMVLWRIRPHSSLIGAVIGSGLVLPLLLLLWLVRRMCYVLQRPATAVFGSGLYFSIVTGGLFLLRHFDELSPFAAFLLMGFASLLASVLLLNRFGVAQKGEPPQGSLLWRPVLRENWKYGRWLVGSTILYSLSNQTQMFLLAGFVGLSAAGVLRAMQIPSLVMTQINTAIALLVLPGFSYDFGRGLTKKLRHKAMIVSVGLGLAALCFVGFLALFGRGAENLLFAGKYAAYVWLMPALALIPVANGISSGYSMALRASQKPHYDLIANAIAAPVGILSALLFMHWWGLAGAAASMILSFVITAVVNAISYRWCRLEACAATQCGSGI